MKVFKSQAIGTWLLGAMLAVTLLLLGTIINMGTARLDRIEAKVDAVQGEYYQIGELRSEGRSRGLQLERLRSSVATQQRQIAAIQYVLHGVVWLLTNEEVAQ